MKTGITQNILRQAIHDYSEAIDFVKYYWPWSTNEIIAELAHRQMDAGLCLYFNNSYPDLAIDIDIWKPNTCFTAWWWPTPRRFTDRMDIINALQIRIDFLKIKYNELYSTNC